VAIRYLHLGWQPGRVVRLGAPVPLFLFLSISSTGGWKPLQARWLPKLLSRCEPIRLAGLLDCSFQENAPDCPTMRSPNIGNVLVRDEQRNVAVGEIPQVP
jgi:hypothetical protein